ncbi:hypothetical protein [Allokutzneria albata]|uniref:Uncharacterized protein n=1 Tax=Allokutzneria albata TaxID=211114 RepID=A0A1G9WRR5_ALLAB|nr:hypothetical protein [Allokutzneria albata]SDM87160.1 hypothetical protein SAMN04489726_3770 [Allokutzneria albata]
MRREEHSDSARDRDPAQPAGRFHDDLIGLDPDDPEAQAFAAHLDRVQSVPKPYTVEGYLTQVGDFAEAANRREGHRRLSAVVVSWTVILALVSAAVVALVTLIDLL